MNFRQVEQGISPFFVKFLPYLKIFQSGAIEEALRNFEKSSNMAKIWQEMKKSLVQLSLDPFFG